MQFALVNDVRTPPAPKLRGVCQYCGGDMTPKCGTNVIWHWAHIPRRDCDPWWENETPWHRQWKSYFPEGWRERIHKDSRTGEAHIADVKTDSGLVIEFQNSPMPPDELESREQFYGDMIWVVNGKHFKSRFHVLDPLPDPGSAFVQDLVFYPQRIDTLGRCFWRRSENPGNLSVVRIHSCREIEKEIWENYIGHHHFHWERPRSVWLDSTKPVYFDFGDAFLYLLQKYDERGLMAIQKWGRGIVQSWGGVLPEIAR